MEAMEFEAKKLLMERLDKNLLDHASTLSSDSGGPTILGVYTLQQAGPVDPGRTGERRTAIRA